MKATGMSAIGRMGVAATAMGLILALTTGTGTALAATGTWTGEAGATWDTSDVNWSGVTGTPWDEANGVGNIALFNTAGATPSVSGTVNANKITFDDTATIGGSGTITLGGTTPKLTANSSATISSALAGTVAVTKDGSGTLVLTNAISPYSGALSVSAGELNLASGCIFTNVSSIIPSAAGATVRLTGGTVTNTVATWNQYRGSFIQESGTNVIKGNVYIGNEGGQSALYRMEGGFLQAGIGNVGFSIGSRNGTFIQTGGIVNVGRTGGTVLQLGGANNVHDAQGLYSISGGTLIATNGSVAIQIGFWGTNSVGTLTIASNAVVNALTTYLGNGNNSVTGILNLEGGVFRVNSFYNNGAFAVHQFNFSGGTLSPFNNNATIGSATAANNTTITLSGTNATISSSDKDGTARTVNIYSKLTGEGGITFTGAGTHNVMSPDNDYTGHTTVNGATVVWSYASLPATADLICINSPTINLAHGGTDTIRRLYVNGEAQDPGTYATATAPAGMTITGDGALEVTETEPPKGTVISIN